MVGMKYEDAFIKYFSRQKVFTMADAKRFMAHIGGSSQYTRVFLHNMVNGGRLYRINKGFYSFQKNEALYGFAFRPFYYGMGYAMTIRKLWTQQSNPVIMTCSLANQGTRSINGTRVGIHRISKNAFFGFDYMVHSGVYVPVSVPEKILLDFFYFRIKIPKDHKNALLNASDRKTLLGYAKRLGPRYESYVNGLLS